MFDYPLYKLRGLSCAVFRACITSVFEKENHIKTTFTMQNLRSNARLLVKCATVSQMRDCIKETERISAPVGYRTRAFERRGWFSRFCGESADRQVGESRFESLHVKNDKRKAN
jgi:hypothetical protein